MGSLTPKLLKPKTLIPSVEPAVAESAFGNRNPACSRLRIKGRVANTARPALHAKDCLIISWPGIFRVQVKGLLFAVLDIIARMQERVQGSRCGG